MGPKRVHPIPESLFLNLGEGLPKAEWMYQEQRCYRTSSWGGSHWDMMTVKQREQVTFWIHSPKTLQGAQGIYCADPVLRLWALGVPVSSLHVGECDVHSACLIRLCGVGTCVLRTLSMSCGCKVVLLSSCHKA